MEQSAPQKCMSKKTKIILGVTAGVMVLMWILVMVLSRPLSPEAAAQNYAAMMNGDCLALQKVAPAEYWEHTAEERNASVFEYCYMYHEGWKKRIDEKREKYGVYNVTCAIRKQEEMDEETLALIAEGLTEYGIKKSDVKAGQYLYVTYTISTSEGDELIHRLLPVVRIGYTWYAVDYTLGYVSFDVTIVRVVS